MNFPLYIAKRYLLKKRANNVVNIISGIAIVGVAIGTIALVVVLSVFNGFEGLVTSLYKSFDPDLKITSAQGKTFVVDSNIINVLNKTEEVLSYSKVVEEKVLLRYGDKQHIAIIKGVDAFFDETTGFGATLKSGVYFDSVALPNTCVIGQGISHFLSLGIEDQFTPLQVYIPKTGLNASLNPAEAFNSKPIYPVGVFSIQADFDSKYVLTPLAFTQKLLQYSSNQVSAIEVGLKESKNSLQVKKKFEKTLGSNFKVNTQMELHEVLFKMMKTEKQAVLIIFTLILIIATFNMAGAIVMLIIDKQKDIVTLTNLGTEPSTIQIIYFLNGFMTNVIGAIIGLSVGAILCYIQEKFKIIGLGEGFVIDYYPVDMNLFDLTIIVIIILAIGIIMAYLPTRILRKSLLDKSY